MPALRERRKAPDGTLVEWDGTGWLPASLNEEPSPTPAPPQAAPSWSERMGLGGTTNSPTKDFFRGAASGVVDLAQGAVGNLSQQLRGKQEGDRAMAEEARAAAGSAMPIRNEPMVPTTNVPQNFSGKVGSMIPVVAEMVAGGRQPAATMIDAIPSTVRAGKNFQSVMAAAKDVPIETKEIGDIALRIHQLSENGGQLPIAVRKLLNRMTDPNKGALAYGDARDFASNISRLSVNEMKRLTPVVAREVAGLSAALSRANARAAQQVGKFDEYAAAMNEYAKAMRLRNAVDVVVQGAKKGLPYATAAGAGTWLTKKIYDALE